ncbi:MAG: YeeE/YedE family protein [Acidimicrobiia bacterium]|nr:YeeE/YedE family protein [Acidimicrobiia bacterium]
MSVFYVLLGTVFGVVLSRSGAADYDYIQGMFLFDRFQLYGIIGSAVVLTAPGLWLIKRRARTPGGRPIQFETKSLNRGTVLGGVLFGVGWSIAGMCPGPILVNIGEGKVYALAALAGALIGAGAFGALYERLQQVLGLPPLAAGERPLRPSA